MPTYLYLRLSQQSLFVLVPGTDYLYLGQDSAEFIGRTSAGTDDLCFATLGTKNIVMNGTFP